MNMTTTIVHTAKTEITSPSVLKDTINDDELVQVIIRVPWEMRRQMKIKAATLNTSMNDYIRHLIESDLRGQNQER
jgi:MoxR-like ATPase